MKKGVGKLITGALLLAGAGIIAAHSYFCSSTGKRSFFSDFRGSWIRHL